MVDTALDNTSTNMSQRVFEKATTPEAPLEKAPTPRPTPAKGKQRTHVLPPDSTNPFQ
ncbi:MAG: hypothetical protein NT062_16395 [Proteobacteria bacterium]|nr:hypothetical protein [Pseudomonadota bacterium]